MVGAGRLRSGGPAHQMAVLGPVEEAPEATADHDGDGRRHGIRLARFFHAGEYIERRIAFADLFIGVELTD